MTAHLGWMALIAGGWGGLLAVERKAFLQAMVSRPLVAATFLGLLLDDITSGVQMGMVLELYYLGSANMGASVPEHDTLVATGATGAAVALAARSGDVATPALWTLAILVFLGLGRFGRWLDHRLEAYAARLARRALVVAESGNLTRAVRQNLWGMWPHLCAFAVINAACVAAGWWVAPWVARLPGPLLKGLAFAFPILAAVSAIVAVRGSHARYASFYALGAGVLVVALSFLFGGRVTP
ncbi:MAG: PTS sugar transporter subunit IIC [Myxococcaceae bacterium]